MFGMVGLTAIQELSEHIESNIEVESKMDAVRVIDHLILTTRQNEHLIESEINNLKHHLK